MIFNKEKLIAADGVFSYQVYPDTFENMHEAMVGPGIVASLGTDCDGLIWVKSLMFDKAYDQEQATTWLEENFDKVTAYLFKVPNVEIFSVGKWNGHDITIEDLNDMVSCFKATGHVPALKLGHNNAQGILESAGLPSAGAVGDLRVKGTKLIADFIDIPKKIYALIKAKAYRAVSSEVFNNVTIGGQKYRKMLSAVALLGDETPAVMDLKGILSLYSAVPFTSDSVPDIIKINKSEFNSKKGNAMPELAAEKAKTAQLQKENEELLAFKAKAELEAKEAKLNVFVNSLETDKLISPAMKPLIAALVGEKETYSHNNKTLNREELVKEILGLSAEFSKLNFAQKTTKGDPNKNMEDEKMMSGKIQKYADEKKISFSDAYKCTDGGKTL